MRRILSVIFVLTMVMGATGLFAAQADWKGYFQLSFRTTSQETEAGDKSYSKYFWQKLELYPTWKLSDNVALHAGFFTQNYWGSGRMFGFGADYPITADNGSFVGKTDLDPLTQVTDEKGRPVYNSTLGVSAAWTTIKFQVGDGELGIDAGRRKNPLWGTGAFFGADFAPDRIFLTYKTAGMGGMMIPFFIYENRDSGVISYAEGAGQNGMEQLLFGLIFLDPGKTLGGIVINPNFVSKDYQNVVETTAHSPIAGINDSAVFWAIDLYADHKVKVNDTITVKPILDVVYAFGTADQGTGLTAYFRSLGAGTLYPTLEKITVDVLNIIFKVEVTVKDLVTLTPEFGINMSPKAGSTKELVYNFWAVNEFCGGAYKVGNIFSGVRGGSSTVASSAFLSLPGGPGDVEQDKGGWMYVKVMADADIVGTFVKGLNVYASFIMAQALKETKDLYYNGLGAGNPANYSQLEDSEKGIVTEIDLGVSYKIDAFTTFAVDFGYAMWGKSPLVANTKGSQTKGAAERTDMYLGADLTIKF